jgi:hypothetical protein
MGWSYNRRGKWFCAVFHVCTTKKPDRADYIISSILEYSQPCSHTCSNIHLRSFRVNRTTGPGITTHQSNLNVSDLTSPLQGQKQAVSRVDQCLTNHIRKQAGRSGTDGDLAGRRKMALRLQAPLICWARREKELGRGTVDG